MPRPAARPRVLFVGGTTYDLPLSPSLAKKWDALEQRMELRVVARGFATGEDRRFRLVSVASGRSAAMRWLLLPLAVLQEARRLHPQVVITQSPFEAVVVLPLLRLMRPRPRLVVELHSDWRTATRGYGSKRRRIYAGLADSAAVRAM